MQRSCRQSPDGAGHLDGRLRFGGRRKGAAGEHRDLPGGHRAVKGAQITRPEPGLRAGGGGHRHGGKQGCGAKRGEAAAKKCTSFHGFDLGAAAAHFQGEIGFEFPPLGRAGRAKRDRLPADHAHQKAIAVDKLVLEGGQNVDGEDKHQEPRQPPMGP